MYESDGLAKPSSPAPSIIFLSPSKHILPGREPFADHLCRVPVQTMGTRAVPFTQQTLMEVGRSLGATFVDYYKIK